MAEMYCVEVEYADSDIDLPISVFIGIATPEARADANTTYSFFEDEAAAAADYRRWIDENPGIHYHQDEYNRYV